MCMIGDKSRKSITYHVHQLVTATKKTHIAISLALFCFVNIITESKSCSSPGEPFYGKGCPWMIISDPCSFPFS